MLEPAIDAVFAHDGERAGIDVLDGRDVDARADRACATSRCARRAGRRRARMRRLFDRRPARARGTAPAGARRVRKRHLDDHAERAFGADEQIDEVHAGARRSSRPIASARPACGSGGTRTRLDAGRVTISKHAVRSTRAPPLDVEHVAAGEDDREAVDPVAHGAVLEGRGAGRVGRDRAADGGAEIRRHRRQPAADGSERILQGLQRDAGAGATRSPSMAIGSAARCSTRRRRAASRRRSATTARRRARSAGRPDRGERRRLRRWSAAARRRPHGRPDSERHRAGIDRRGRYWFRWPRAFVILASARWRQPLLWGALWQRTRAARPINASPVAACRIAVSTAPRTIAASHQARSPRPSGKATPGRRETTPALDSRNATHRRE